MLVTPSGITTSPPGPTYFTNTPSSIKKSLALLIPVFLLYLFLLQDQFDGPGGHVVVVPAVVYEDKRRVIVRLLGREGAEAVHVLCHSLARNAGRISSISLLPIPYRTATASQLSLTIQHILSASLSASDRFSP